MQKCRPADEQDGKELRQLSDNTTNCLLTLNVKHYRGDVRFLGRAVVRYFWCDGIYWLRIGHLSKCIKQIDQMEFYYAWTNHYLGRFIAVAADKSTTMGAIKRMNSAKAEVFIPTEAATMKAIYFIRFMVLILQTNRE